MPKNFGNNPLVEAIEVEENVSARNKAENLATNEKSRRQIDNVSDEIIKEGFKFFEEKGIEPDGVYFVWDSNEKAALAIVAEGGRIRFELTDYGDYSDEEMREEYKKYKEEFTGHNAKTFKTGF